MNETKFKFGLDAIGHLIQDRNLEVPVYQRSYAWEDKEVGEYWNDIRPSVEQDGSEYFIGTLVLCVSGGKVAVIDGQQRIATTALLLAAARNVFAKRGDQKRSDAIHNNYLSHLDIDVAEDRPRLKLNSVDDPYYRQRVIAKNAAATTANPSHKLIHSAITFFETKLEKVAVDGGANWAAQVLKWVKFVGEKLRVIVLEVPDEASAFLIFETLNDRGADLTIADLLKNYLFGRAGTAIDTVRNGWIEALGALESSPEKTIVVTFLRHYWSSKYGATRERDLYKSIRERVTSQAHAIDFVADLKIAARHYAATMNSDHDFWSELGTSATTNVQTLLRLDLEQNRPLLLAIMQHFSKDELKKSLRSLVAWSVRGLITGVIGGGVAEAAYCNAAVQVRNGSVKDTAALLTALGTIVPTDDEFKSVFAQARVPKARLARYLLLAMERKKSGQAEPELVPNANEEEVNLEHVLPKNATATDWPQFTQDERESFVHYLGNMALLQRGPNLKIGNKAFSVKKPILTASALKLTSEAGSEADWTKDAIKRRQEKLAQLAVTVWPRT